MKNEKEWWLPELKSLMDDPIRGLRDSSNTNKTRHSLMALAEEIDTRARQDERRKMREMVEKVRETKQYEYEDWIIISTRKSTCDAILSFLTEEKEPTETNE